VGAFAKIHHIQDGLNHALDICKHIVVPKSQHAVAVRFEIACPLFIDHAVGMLAAVNLNDDPILMAGKIREIGSYRCLPAKVGSVLRNLTEISPKFFLGFCRVATKPAGARYALVDLPRRTI
jgi:hypothetical protein